MEPHREVSGMRDLNSCLCPWFYPGQKPGMLQVLWSLVSDLFSYYFSSSFTQLPGGRL